MARSYAGFRFVRTLDGGPPAMRHYGLVAATAYKAGQPLRLSSTTGSAARLHSGTSIVGVANADVANATDITTLMPIYLATDNNIFEVKMLASSTPRAKLHDVVNCTVTSIHNYRLQGTAGTQWRIVGFNPDHAPRTAATGINYWVIADPQDSLLDTATTAF